MIINTMNVEKYNKNKHKGFIEKCMASSDYKFINIDETELNYSDIYVFSKKDIYTGFLITNISNITEVVISKPIIYISKKRTLDSALMIFTLLELMFNHLNIEVIHIPIYSDNKRMINLIENNNIRFMGRQRNYRSTDILYYILSKEDYFKIYASGNYKYG